MNGYYFPDKLEIIETPVKLGIYVSMLRSSHPGVFLVKGALIWCSENKIYSKFTGKHP